MTGLGGLDWVVILGIPSIIGVLTSGFIEYFRERRREKFEFQQTESQRIHEERSLRIQKEIELEAILRESVIRRRGEWLDIQWESLNYVIVNIRTLRGLTRQIEEEERRLSSTGYEAESDYVSDRITSLAPILKQGNEVIGQIQASLTRIVDDEFVQVAQEVLDNGRRRIHQTQSIETSTLSRGDFDSAIRQFDAAATKAVRNLRSKMHTYHGNGQLELDQE